MYSSNCSLCERKDRTNSVCQPAEVIGTGGTVLIIDESPRTGRARSVLDSELAKANITDYRYTSLVKCADFGGDKPETSEIKACSVYLQAELKAYAPQHILTLGAAVSKSVAGKAKITEVAGQVLDKDGYKIVPCYSPSYVLRDPSKAPEFTKIIKRFASVVRGQAETEEKKIRVRIVDRSNLQEFINQFAEEREFAYDLETSGLDHYRDSSFINCIGMYLPLADTAWVIPVRKNPTLPEDAIRTLVTKLASYGKPAIGQNVKFDSLWMRRKFGVHFVTSFDTMLAHHLLDENSAHGLKYLARIYLNAPDYDLTLKEKLGDCEPTKFFNYCAWDCYYTYQLKLIFSRELMKDKPTRDLFYKMVIPASRMMEYVETVGHHVNLTRFNQTQIDLELKLKDTLQLLRDLVGREVNWNSAKQVSEVLYGDLGMIPKVFTDGGAPSSGEAALAELDHPVVKLLTDYRSYQKMLSTYIEGWKEFMIEDRLFLSTKLHGTVTGRWSSRLHQVPRDGTIRNLIEAPAGWTFVQADLSQAELRVVAMASGDPELIQCYRDKIDVHWRTAINNIRLGATGSLLDLARNTIRKWTLGDQPVTVDEICNLLERMGHDKAIELNKAWKEIRKQAKGINFGYVYGMGARKFVEYALVKYNWEITISEAENIRNAFFATYSYLTAWHERQRALVKVDGFVRNLAGRKRNLPGIHSPDGSLRAECERQAINAPIQGFIGDVKVMGMLAIFQNTTREELQILGEVHDSILMWVRNDRIDSLLPVIKSSMENPYLLEELGIKLSVPIVADLEIGTWGAGKVWTASTH